MRLTSSAIAGLLFALSASPSFAQDSLRTSTVLGVVMDPATRQPLANATVTSAGVRDTARTGADGRFILRNVPRNGQDIKVARAGYLTAILPQFVIATDTLHFSADLHTDPPTVVNTSSNGRVTPVPVMYIRFSPNRVALLLDPDALGNIKSADIAAVDVIVGGACYAKRFGTAGQVGVIRLLLPGAAAFSLPDFPSGRC